MRHSEDSLPAGRTERGRIGEDLAESFLELQGLDVLDRNVRAGPREVDLIAVDSSWWVVVEVRLRRVSSFGSPEESVDRRKREQLLRAGQELWCRTDRRRALRFDLVTLSLRSTGLDLRHHRFFIDPDRSPRSR